MIGPETDAEYNIAGFLGCVLATIKMLPLSCAEQIVPLQSFQHLVLLLSCECRPGSVDISYARALLCLILLASGTNSSMHHSASAFAITCSRAVICCAR